MPPEPPTPTVDAVAVAARQTVAAALTVSPPNVPDAPRAATPTLTPTVPPTVPPTVAPAATPTLTPDAAATRRAAEGTATAGAIQVQAAIGATLAARATETAVATRLTPAPTPTPDAPATATANAAQVEAAAAATLAARWTATAAATRLTPAPTPTPTPGPVAVSLELPTSRLSAEANLGLERGLNTLLGIPFDTTWQASTQCSNMADRPERIVLDVAIPHPRAAYLLLQAGWGLNEYAGRRVGSVRLAFSDGMALDTPLVLGDNIRDWTRANTVAVTTVSSPDVQPAWQGLAPDGSLGGMDVLTIAVPDGQQRSTLTRIEVADLSRQAGGDLNPCIHLLALTVYR